ncbi:DUF3081 domain-containing protein [Vibrio sp. FNV 38]|nr:DUF3081 domain-containing protein [Vibrio sp. FNV 38]
MKNDLDAIKILHAYERIMANGVPTENGMLYEGVEAIADYDGYNIYLRGNGVELSVGFHNTYQMEYDQAHLKESFLKKVALLSK